MRRLAVALALALAATPALALDAAPRTLDDLLAELAPRDPRIARDAWFGVYRGLTNVGTVQLTVSAVGDGYAARLEARLSDEVGGDRIHESVTVGPRLDVRALVEERRVGDGPLETLRVEAGEGGALAVTLSEPDAPPRTFTCPASSERVVYGVAPVLLLARALDPLRADAFSVLELLPEEERLRRRPVRVVPGAGGVSGRPATAAVWFGEPGGPTTWRLALAPGGRVEEVRESDRRGLRLVAAADAASARRDLPRPAADGPSGVVLAFLGRVAAGEAAEAAALVDWVRVAGAPETASLTRSRFLERFAGLQAELDFSDDDLDWLAGDLTEEAATPDRVLVDAPGESLRFVLARPAPDAPWRIAGWEW